jgi:transposase-like protein
VSWEKGEAPPIVRLDGIWMTILIDTGETKLDRLQRKRPVKRGKPVAVLAAQAVWPNTGETKLIAWMRVEGEGTDAWQTFLETLYQSGVTPENGLVMLVADGSKGFRSAYENVYWQTPFQRCVFHKLRNVAKAIHTPANMNHEAARQFRTHFLRSASRIWQADDENEARLLNADFCNQWRSSQPNAVRTLENDFEDTLSFFSVQESAASRGDTWPARYLRTTSHLERMFREFRRRYRNALAFHSSTGLLAVTAQIAARFS